MQPLPSQAWSQAAWGVLAGLSLGLSAITPAIAQTSVTAATDNTGTTVGYDAATQTYNINGGTQFNANLFHSFQQLGLSAGEIASFWVNPDVANVLARITGGQASVINGLLQVSGGNNPNLFVLNPAGVLLSPNARLNLAGSFSVSTASGLAFGDGVFNAIGGNDYSALVGDPSGYIFLGNEGVLLNEADLSVNPGENIALAGNTVINTGSLDASEGTVSIVAVPEAGLIQISQAGLILSLAIPTDQLQGRVNTGITPLDLPELLAGEWNGEATTVNTLADGTVVLNSGDPANADPGAITSTGTVDVSGPNGGQVVFRGEDIALPAGLIDISGTVGGELGVYAQDELTLGAEVNAAGGGHALFDPTTFTIGTAEAATIVSTLAGGDATVEAAETINVNGAIDSSSQRRNRNTLTFQDENGDNNLTINLNALITLGRRQTLAGQGTTVNVNVTDPGIVQNAVDLAATGATVNLGAGTYQEGTQVTLNRDITLTGAGNTQLDGNNTHRLLRVNRGVTANLNDLMITQGRSRFGGGVYNQGTLILNGSAIANNRATRDGGGIYNNNGEVTLTNSELTSNRANRNGGGIFANRGTLTLDNSQVANNQASRDGGGIRSNRSLLTLNRTQLVNNRASRDGGGLRSNGNTVTLNQVQVSGNSANRNGGGLWATGTLAINSGKIAGNQADQDGGGIYSSGTLNLANSLVSNNQAGRNGGGIRTNNSTASLNTTTVTGNQAGRDGGGLHTNRGTLTVDRSSISSNTATRDGGGIRSNRGAITFDSSTVANNGATRNGGGIYGNRTNLSFSGSTVSTNGAQLGGGIYNNRGTAVAINSTVSGNNADQDGGGIYSNRGNFTLNNATVANNQSDRGGGLYGNRATLTLSNTLIAGNSALGQGNEVAQFRGTVTSNHTLFGFSGDAGLSGMTANLANGDLVPTLPLSQILSPLANNGGPTQTHALVVGSPALDAGDNSATTADQRGIAAIGPRDIGAFEGTIAPEEASFENTLFTSLEPLNGVEGVACQTLDLTPELRETLGLVSAPSSLHETESGQTTAALRAGASPECPDSTEMLEPGH